MWWKRQMRNARKESVKLEEELRHGERDEDKMRKLSKLKRREELASSWLKQNGVEVQEDLVRRGWGEYTFAEEEEVTHEAKSPSTKVLIESIKPTLEDLAEQSELYRPMEVDGTP